MDTKTENGNGKGSITAPKQSGIIRKKASIEKVEDYLSEIDVGGIKNITNFNQQVIQEEQIAYEIELSRLGEIEKARIRGIERAHSENQRAVKARQLSRKKHFANNELPELLDNCAFLPFDKLQSTVNAIAAIVNIKLNWEEKDDGTYTCTPQID